MPRKRPVVTAIHPAGNGFAVSTLNTSDPDGQTYLYRREPCAQCPWRKDIPPGAFPAEAFRHSARTCTDMALSTFACHMSGDKAPATCAGFLLSADAAHNLQLRLKAADGGFKWREVKSPFPVFKTYADMAVANGVPADDPALLATRGRR